MSQRQFATPLLIQDGKVVTLHRVEFQDNFHDETWVQELLFSHPELIPFEELEPAFKGSIAVAREVESGAGPADVLFVNSDGLLTIVETKLWRNPQARREVVSQLIHYAAGFANMEYKDLVAAIKNASGSSDGLVERMKANGIALDETRFHDAVSRNLRRGRFLLLAIGDGIQEGVETMAEFLQGQPQLGFSLRLIELGLFRLDPNKNDPIFCQPRIVVRTREVVRAIVKIDSDHRIEVSTPPEEPQNKPKRFTITEGEFYRLLSDNITANEVAFVKRIIEEAPRHQLDVDWKQGGPLLKYTDNDAGTFFSIGGFNREGDWVNEYLLSQRCIQLGLPENIWTDYLNELVRIIPGARRVKGTIKPDGRWEGIDYAGSSLKAIMANEADWWTAIDKVICGLKKAMTNPPSQESHPDG
jgi:hypothetical protein